MGENDMLSQDEINALLNGVESDETENEAKPEENADLMEEALALNDSAEADSGDAIDQNIIDDMHKDTLGEIGNISMGSAATTLSMLLNQKVQITTPTVSITNLEEVKRKYPIPCLLIDVKYTQGLTGSNILMIDLKDAAIIADLMMGGDGSNYSEELSEIHLSAVSEAMNQMMGSTATSISGMFGKKIDISPPYVKSIDLSDAEFEVSELDKKAPLAKVSFKMEIGTLINSNIMQLIPIAFAKEMVNNLMNGMNNNETKPEIEEDVISEPAPAVSSSPPAPEPQPVQPNPAPVQPPVQQPMMQQPIMQQPVMMPPPVQPQQPVNVQPAQFAPLTAVQPQEVPANMGLLMDVPLQATVELGRTKMPIKEILDLGVGSIIELDKLAGEPVDLVVNGKLIAKGEVVVIDENFGLRITDILSTNERISTF